MKRCAVVLLLLLLGCNRGAIPVHSLREQTSNVAENVTYREHIRMVPVFVQLPSQRASYTGPADSSLLETDLAESGAFVDSSGLLHHWLQNKDTVLADSVLVKDTETSVRKDSTAVLFERVEIPVPYPQIQEVYRMRWWQRWLAYIGLAYLLRVTVKLLLNRKTLTLKTILKLL